MNIVWRMMISRADYLVQACETNTWLIGRLTDGVTQRESLLTPNFPTNCVNWILGHILVSRNEALELCNSKIWPDEWVARYKAGSQPVAWGDDDVLLLEQLLTDLRGSLELFGELLPMMTAEFDEVVKTARGEKPRWEHIRGLHWHETYHIGQLEMLQSFIEKLRE